MTRAKGSDMDNTSTSTVANSISGGTSVGVAGGGVGVSSMGRTQMNCGSGSLNKERPTTPNNSTGSTPGATSNFSSATGGGGGNTTAQKSNSATTTGSQPVYPAPAELLPKLKSILPAAASQCTYTPCYW